MALYGAAFSAQPTVCDFDPSNQSRASWVRFETLGCLQLVMIPRPGVQKMRVCHKIPKPTPFTPSSWAIFGPMALYGAAFSAQPSVSDFDLLSDRGPPGLGLEHFVASN